VPGLIVRIRAALADGLTPDDPINEIVESVSAADTTGVLRYESSSGTYMYNLDTRSLDDGNARYVIEVSAGGSTNRTGFGLRTK
jgi:hypothetical protein